MKQIMDNNSEYVQCENSNLRFHGTKLDRNGNECAVFSTPNHNTFSIQRNSLWGTQSWNTGTKSTMDAETFLAKNPKVSLESLERDVIKLANQTKAAWGKNIRVHNKQILDSKKRVRDNSYSEPLFDFGDKVEYNDLGNEIIGEITARLYSQGSGWIYQIDGTMKKDGITGWHVNAAREENIKPVSDSRRVKDENTPDVLDGVLFVAFEDGTEDDMIAEVSKHKNESGEIGGVQYETYETDNSDGVAMIDLCAMTGDANGFVKALLNEWGVAENVIDLEFQASDEMKEAVNDSRKQVRDNVDDDYEPPFAVYEDGMFAERFDTEKEAVEYAKHLDFKYEHETEIFVVDESGGVVDDIVWSSEWVSDSRVNDMTKPAHLRGYAERVRAKRRNKSESRVDEPENEKQDVADSRRVRDSYDDDTILHFHTGRGGRYNNQGYTTYEGVYEKGLTNFALTYNAITEGDGEYQDGQELIDGNGKSLGAKYGDMVGYLDWDGDYDSDSFIYLNEVEFDDSAFQTIVSSDEYLEPNVRAYIANLVIDNLNAYTLNNLPTYNDNDYEDKLDDIVNDICKDLGISNGYVRDTVRDILDQMANQ